MEILISILIIAVILYLFFLILPVVLPIILIILLIAFGYILYMKHKIRKNIEKEIDDFENQTYDDFTTYEYTDKNTNIDDVIDVEYTEREEDE